MSIASVQEARQAFLASTFYIGEALCGVDTTAVQEVIQVDDVTPVHHAADYILGIINLRGKIVTVIDLSRKLRLTGCQTSEDSRIFIVEWQDEYIGLLVDRVSDVVAADRGMLSPPPSNISGVQAKYFDGVYRSGQELVAILNLEAVLAFDGD